MPGSSIKDARHRRSGVVGPEVVVGGSATRGHGSRLLTTTPMHRSLRHDNCDRPSRHGLSGGDDVGGAGMTPAGGGPGCGDWFEVCPASATRCRAASLSSLVDTPRKVQVEKYLLPRGMTGMKKSENHVLRRATTCAAGET